MATGNPLGLLLLGHQKSVTNHLQTAWSCNKAATKRNIMCEHMLDSSIRIFYIFSHNSEVYVNSGLTEYGINPMETLKNPVISVGIPGFARCNVYTFDPFTFWRFHGSLE